MRRLVYLILFLAAVWAGAQQPATRIPLAKDQLIVFLGDSITQQNLYTRDVELLLNARYPDLHLHFVNAGWSGRHAAHLIDDAVLHRDLLRLKPDVVLILFGMNDGWYRNPPDPVAMTAYRTNMAALVGKIHTALPTCRIVLMTPTVCDSTHGGFLRGYNDTLGQMAGYIRDLARQQGTDLIDIYSPMLEAETAAKAADPKFTMFLDGVHPTPVGHWLIATTISEAFGVTPRLDSSVTIDSATGSVTSASQSVICDVRNAGGALTFTQLFSRAPVALPLDARNALTFTRVQTDRDRAMLAITGLSPATRYGMYANDQFVGRFTGDTLAQGVDWLDLPVENAFTGRMLQLAMTKYNYRWTAWRAPDTGLSALDPQVVDAKDWQELDSALARLARRADDIEYRLVDAARMPHWRIIPERSIPLSQWVVTGPYVYQTSDTLYPPETDAANLSWTPISATPDGLLDFTPTFGTYRNCVVYARTRIYVPRAARLTLSLGSDGAVKAWVNGTVCLADEANRAAAHAQDTAAVTLAPGWNTVLVRERRGDQGWSCYAEAYLSGLSDGDFTLVSTGP